MEAALLPEGLRERKRRETSRRIAETGLKLFLKNGYENTTLDEIAAAAGISRRTFFYYFKTKEAILLSYVDGGFARSIRPVLLSQSTDLTPFEAARNSILQVMAVHDTEEGIAFVRLLGSSEVLKTRIPGLFVDMEEAVLDGLSELWPDPEIRPSLRMVAMVCIGALRIGKETWQRDNGKRPLSEYLKESFDTVAKAI